MKYIYNFICHYFKFTIYKRVFIIIFYHMYDRFVKNN